MYSLMHIPDNDLRLSHTYNHARQAHEKMKSFGLCVVIRWACVKTR